MAEGQFTSSERVYVDKEGRRVDAKDPKRHTLLVAAGGQIPMEKARAAGLATEEGQAPEAAADADTGAIDPAEESERIQATAGGAAAGDSKKGSKKSSKKK